MRRHLPLTEQIIQVQRCPICLTEFDPPLSPVGLENHKSTCREKQLEDVKHRKEVAGILHNFKPMSLADVGEILGSTIRRDRTTKLLLFGAMELTYTEQEQVNVLMAAESSAGKSYLPLEIAQYF